MSRKVLFPLLAAALVASLPALPAVAQDDSDPYAACAATIDDAARLACFDGNYAAQATARAETARLRAEREALEEQRRAEEFGFTGPDLRDRREALAEGDPDLEARIADLDAAERAEREYSVSATVTEVLTNSQNRVVLMLDNGTMWRERPNSPMRGRPRTGWTATMTSHWSGAFEMRFEERSGLMRVERVR